MIGKILSFLKKHLFSIISWIVTFAIVAGLAGTAMWWTENTSAAAAMVPEPTAQPDQNPPKVSLPATVNTTGSQSDLTRQIELKTDIPADKPRYDEIEYTVEHGDSVVGIAKNFDITPETLLMANYDQLEDDPHSLRPGQKLHVPPVDGLYYKWKEGDTLDTVATEYKATVDDIVNWPGNNLDLTNPEIKAGQWVMIPGGEREIKPITLPTIARGSGTGTSGTSQAACGGGGAVGSGAFVWPADNHFLSGNDYWSGHLGIDIAAGEGAPIYAADSGVVTLAQGGDNYGYGNVIQIDHGNGYSTLYAHLSVIGVSVCTSVSAGQWIGAAGNTGNSQGAHLHFEVRKGGANINPWYVLP
jgi:murein DD-endopeptidase MepM/ murein hydrolase activator NlpD